MSAPDTVRVEHLGAVARIVLDRPDRHNAQTTGMWRELRSAVETLAAEAEIKAAVLTGAGPSFSSGLDLVDEQRPGGLLDIAARSGPVEAGATIERVQADFRAIMRAPFPVIGAVRGAAIGAGFQLAVACDVRIVADDAALSVAEVGLGAVPDLGATTDLPRLIGLERSLDLILSARRFSGSDAVAWGLALRAVPDEDVETEALAYAERLARAPRLALARAKEAAREPDPAASLRLAARGQVECVRAALAGGSIFGRQARHG